MFETVTIGAYDNGTGLGDVGAIAEALLFYGRTNLVLTRGNLALVVNKFGFDNLIRCMDMGALEISYERKRYSVITATSVIRYHDFGNTEIAATHDGRKISNLREDIEEVLIRSLGDTEDVRRRARVLSGRIKARDGGTTILPEARRDARNKDYLHSSVVAILGALTPEYRLPADFHISATETSKGFVLATNLDLREINRHYHLRVPATHSSIDEGFLLSHILDARKELVFSAQANSDLWVGPAVSGVLRNKVNACAARLTKRQEELDCFYHVEFEGRNFRDAINSGARSMSDLMRLIEDNETVKFKKWLAGRPHDGSLIREYHKAVLERHAWVDRLPLKMGKILAFAGIGAVVDLALGSAGLATAAATAISAGSSVLLGTGDEFVISKLGAGWRPNHFIENVASRFLSE